MSNNDGSPPIFTDPNSLRNWLATLPWLDCHNTGNCILTQIRALNHTVLSTGLRYQLLEEYYPYLLQLVDGLENFLFDTALPLSKDSKLQAMLALELYQEVSEGYLITVFAKDFLKAKELSKSDQTTALVRAIDSLQRVQVLSAQVYEPLDDTFWRKVYRLYEMAEYDNLFEDNTPSSHMPVFNQAHFLRLFLFSLCAPQRFRQRDLKQIDLFLQSFAQFAEIHSKPSYQQKKAYFHFDLYDPTPPRSAKLVEHPESIGSRFIYCQEVVKQLLKFISNPPAATGKSVLPVNATRKLALQIAHSLGAPKHRKWGRMQENSECLLVVGLEDLIAVLNKEGKIHQNLKSLLATPSGRMDENLLSTGDFDLLPLDGDELFDTGQVIYEGMERDVYQRLVNQMYSTPDFGLQEKPAQRDQDNKQNHFPGKLLNSSAQGYCLIWMDHALSKLKVGELLVVLNHGDDLEIGAIRWLQKDPDQGLLVGIEIITFAINVVVVNLKISPDAQGEFRREWGLLIPPQPTLGRPTSLLSPAFVWQQGQWVQVHHQNGKVENYWLKSLVDSTPAFDLFALEKTV
ncbi:MAG TPA: hypothetical protein ENJ86_11765 [Methylothermaceae bacterium]|nr:hypothetical protein [Methylothermaceae bacterium]